MVILKIEDSKGFYCLKEGEKVSIDKINKDDLLELLNLAIENEYSMHVMDEENIKNKAHRIIYSNIYGKFLELKENKMKFRDESESMYRDAIEKYTS